MDDEKKNVWKERCSGLILYYHNTCLKKFRKITKKSDQRIPVCRLSNRTLYLTGDLSAVFVCLFSWRYNPLWLYFHSPVKGFSLLVFVVY